MAIDRFDPELEELASAFIGACIEVHRHLGQGHVESIYANALAEELALRGIEYEREYSFEVVYKDARVGEGRIDFLVGKRLPCELKATKGLDDSHIAQTLFYMANVRSPLGLLVNFNAPVLKSGIRRIVDHRFS